MTLSLMFVTYILCLVYDTYDHSTFIDQPMFYTYLDPIHNFYVIGPKYVSEILLQDLCLGSELRCEFTYLCHMPQNWSVAMSSLTWN